MLRFFIGPDSTAANDNILVSCLQIMLKKYMLENPLEEHYQSLLQYQSDPLAFKLVDTQGTFKLAKLMSFSGANLITSAAERVQASRQAAGSVILDVGKRETSIMNYIRNIKYECYC